MKKTKKRLFAVLLLCAVLSIPVLAQTENVAKEKQTPQQGTMMPGQMGPGMMGGQQMMNQMMPMMMQQCQKMMGQMTMGQNMMSQEMLSMMKDIVKMQEKIIANPDESEKQQMVLDMTQMMEKIDRHMSMLNQMTGGQMGPKQQKQPEPEEKEAK